MEKDFKHRCAYCNMKDEIVKPLPFQVDHYIPEDAFKNVRPELKTDYENLMYACPKCNSKKRKKYKGNINDKKIENELFYNPVETDYNEIFYRDEHGKILSSDKKGNEMIVMLHLYSPVHQIAWILDEIQQVQEKIKNKIQSNENMSEEKKQKLQEAHYKLLDYYVEMLQIFKANYYSKEWK